MHIRCKESAVWEVGGSHFFTPLIQSSRASTAAPHASPRVGSGHRVALYLMQRLAHKVQFYCTLLGLSRIPWVFLNLCDARSDNTADTGARQFNAGAAHLLPHWKRVRLWQRAAAMTGPLKGCSRSRGVGCRYSRDADLRQQMPPAGLLVPGGLGMRSAWRGAMTLGSGSKSHRLRKTHGD
jgi:hypothetical protein